MEGDLARDRRLTGKRGYSIWNNPGPSDKKWLHFPKGSAIIPSQTQDSYIGNTTASQAVKAGSTPVSCSKKKRPPVGGLFFL